MAFTYAVNSLARVGVQQVRINTSFNFTVTVTGIVTVDIDCDVDFNKTKAQNIADWKTAISNRGASEEIKLRKQTFIDANIASILPSDLQ